MARSSKDLWTQLVGPLGTAATATVVGAGLAAGAAVGVSTARRVGLTRGLVLGGIAFDLVGGLVSFQLPPTRALYARSTRRQRLIFVASHLQPFALPLAGQGSWSRATARYAAAVASSALLEAVLPDSASRRGLATGLGAAASLADLATSPPGQRWFGPVYLMKLIGGHAGIPRDAVSGSGGSR